MTDLKKLLIVDDDPILRERLGRSLQKKGFHPYLACSLAEAKKSMKAHKQDYAIVDLKLEDGYGLNLVEHLRKLNPNVRIIILTGYGNIASAVAAIKHGAVDYLAKPIDSDSIAKALLNQETLLPPPPEMPMSVNRVKWEHIQRIYNECQGNVSQTARHLNMHRRTLQRILGKHAPKI